MKINIRSDPTQINLKPENFRIRKVPLCREKRKHIKIIFDQRAIPYDEPSGSLSVAYQLRLMRKKFHNQYAADDMFPTMTKQPNHETKKMQLPLFSKELHCEIVS